VEVYRQRNGIQQYAGESFLQMTERFSPNLMEVFPTLVAHVTCECSSCKISRTTGSLREMRPMVIDIPPLPRAENLKLQDVFEFGKWVDID
jgi:hypothetical protein